MTNQVTIQAPQPESTLAQDGHWDPPSDMVFDEREEIRRIEVEKRKGKAEYVGNFLVNKPTKIIGVCQDSHGELVYLLAYESSQDEVYTPSWVQSWLLTLDHGDLIDDFIRSQMQPFSQS